MAGRGFDEFYATHYDDLDHRAAYAEFKKLFAGQPVLIGHETPQDLPESYRVELRDGAATSEVAARYRHLPGVQSVEDYSPAPLFQGAASFPGLNASLPKR